jgi:hypothetical protein
MKKLMITMTALASALVLLFPAAAAADASGRTVNRTFEFFAVGQGDLTGLCVNQPANPPQAAPFGSCVEEAPAAPDPTTGAQEDFVTLDVRDSAGNPVYFTVQQDGGGFGWGCGTVTSHPVDSDHPLEGGAFPILGAGAGGGQAPGVLVFPWAGPGLNNALEPGGSACTGSSDTNLVHPGAVGTVRFIFHNEILP